LDETTFLNKDSSGPPSVRGWNWLHARPRKAIDNEPSYVTFATAIDALQSIKPVVSLSIFKGWVDCGKRLAPSALTQWLRRSIFTAFLDVCTHLESFSISIETDETDDYAAPKVLGVLPSILYHMKHLKRLNLGFSTEDSPNSGTRYTYEQVFPQEGQWPRLVDLQIKGLAIGGYQLVCMLSRRFPSLQTLYLSDTELVDGSWEGVIEGMRHTMHLQTLHLGHEFEVLKQRSGASFETAKLENLAAKGKLLFELENYVVSGGRHPSLSTDVPAEEATKFWLDICPLGRSRAWEDY